MFHCNVTPTYSLASFCLLKRVYIKKLSEKSPHSMLFTGLVCQNKPLYDSRQIKLKY